MNKIIRKFRIGFLLEGNIGLLVILFILSLVLAVLSPNFIKITNIITITRQVSINMIVAIGMTYVILTAEIDLSVGAVAALAGVITSLLMRVTGLVFIPIIAGVITGIVVGIINGFLSVKMRVQSFIVTLATMSICRGASLVITRGFPISYLPEKFGFIGSGYVGRLPFIILIAAAFFLIFFYLLRYTKHGLHIKAIGANIIAARLSAVRVIHYKIFTFALCSGLAGIGGILIASRLMSGSPTVATEMNLDVIAAVILGGTSLSGGQGTLVGTLIGSFILGEINNGLNILNVSAFYHYIAKGLIILIAVLLRREKEFD